MLDENLGMDMIQINFWYKNQPINIQAIRPPRDKKEEYLDLV